jgi:hypothetical protein
LALQRKRALKLGGEDKDSRQSAAIQVAQVVRTARRTGPSIRQPHHHRLTLRRDALQ